MQESGPWEMLEPVPSCLQLVFPLGPRISAVAVGKGKLMQMLTPTSAGRKRSSGFRGAMEVANGRAHTLA